MATAKRVTKKKPTKAVLSTKTKTVKKSVATKTAKRELKSEPKVALLTTAQSMPSAMTSGSVFKRPYVFVPLLIVLLGIALYLGKGLFIVAMVNGQPIFRTDFTTQLQQQYGKQVLTNMVTKKIIDEAAAKNNISVSSSDLAAATKQIEMTLSSQGQSLDSALAAQGMTRAQFTDQLRTQKIVEKLFAKDIMVTDDEVSQYIDKNKDTLPQGVTGDQLNAQVRQQLQQQKLSAKFQTWLAQQQQQAKISYFINL